jgi:hypothetical protein
MAKMKLKSFLFSRKESWVFYILSISEEGGGCVISICNEIIRYEIRKFGRKNLKKDCV